MAIVIRLSQRRLGRQTKRLEGEELGLVVGNGIGNDGDGSTKANCNNNSTSKSNSKRLSMDTYGAFSIDLSLAKLPL